MSEVSGGAPAAPASAPASSQPASESSQVANQEVQGQEGQTAQQAIKEEIKAAKRKLKAKVNGQEREFDFDPNDEASIIEMYSKGAAADDRFQQASKKEKEMKARQDEIARMVQEDPEAFLREFGHNLDELSEKHLRRKIEEMEKSPEQRELDELRAKLEKEEKTRQKLEQERETERNEQIKEKYAVDLNQKITSGLAATELPKTPYVVKRLADVLSAGLEHGVDLSVEDAIQFINKQMRREMREMFEIMPEDKLEDFLGSKVNDTLRKRRLAKAKQVKNASTEVRATGQSELNKARPEVQEKPQSARDFFRKL